jgi:cytochrome d ubiquinol oxidase subunit II
MEILWFWLIAFMITMYVILDGFDLGAAAVHFFVAKTLAERGQVIQSIGPVWDGNEVWLLATGGTLYFAFPKLYASSFSGFYLPLMIVLWLLILRGIAIEFRNHIDDIVWVPFWDVVFSAASALLAVFFGAALGNVVRGVPLDSNGRFFEPLWTSFRPVGETGILDWYTITVGLTALSALAMHGALWVAMKTYEPVCGRARRAAGVLWWATISLTMTTTVLTLRLQPHVVANLTAYPWGAMFPGLAILGIAGTRVYILRSNESRSFLASSAYLLGMMTSAAFGVYPYVLPASRGTQHGLTLFDAAAAPYGLRVGLIWWTIGMALVSVYFVFVYHRFGGKVKEGAE